MRLVGLSCLGIRGGKATSVESDATTMRQHLRRPTGEGRIANAPTMT